ncbi:hypothetical protein JCM11251_003261 [Rhodosporidiobolus azoricus]
MARDPPNGSTSPPPPAPERTLPQKRSAAVAAGRSGSSGEGGTGKRRAGPASCRECIRLKLKCSREWPCTSCVRRGCPSICPDGSLPHKDSLQQAKTIKSLLAQNETLSAALSMQNLRSLGGATDPPTGQGQDAASAPRAPSGPSTLSIPRSSSQGRSPDNEAASPYESAAGKGPGVIEVAGAATFHGRGAGALFLIDGEFKDVDWMYRPCLRSTIEADLNVLYAGPSASLQSGVTPLHPHRVALLLSVFSIAVVFQQPIRREPSEGLRAGHRLFNAASNLLTAAPHNFMSRPTVASVQCLHVMVSCLFCSGDKVGAKSAWTLLGLAMRAAQSLGLHKNCNSWNLPREETLERARTWWELFTYDLLQSLNFGRPYGVPMQFVQCPTPSTLEPLASDHSSQFHTIKYDLALLFARVADLLASTDLPDYAEVLALDRTLRAHEARAPEWLRLTDFSGALRPDDTPGTVAQRHMLCLLLHKALLALHRPWFAKAVMHDSGAEPMTTPWAASFNACCISARKHVHLMKSILISSPQAGFHWWFFLFHTFTSAVIQSSVLLRAPNCMLADDIRNDFNQAFSVFAEVAPFSDLGRRGYAILHKLRSSITPGGSRIEEYGPDKTGQGASAADNPLAGLGDDSLFGQVPAFDMDGGSSSLFPGPSFMADGLSSAPSYSDGAAFPTWDLTHDPAGVLLSNSGDPLAWDPLNWETGGSIDQTLMFWNLATAGGTFDFTTASGSEAGGAPQNGSLF